MIESVALLLLVVSYLAVGTVYSRRRAALPLSTAPCPDGTAAFDVDNHKVGCRYRAGILLYNNREDETDEPCTCNMRSAHLEMTRAIKAWDASQKRPDDFTVYIWMLFWPLSLHKTLLLPPQNSETRRERRMRYELENEKHIAEVTAILDGNQKIISSLDIEEVS